MCGLLAIKRFDGKSATKMVERRYREQKERGTEGFGFAAFKDGKLLSYLRSGSEKPILDALAEQDADEVLFHHRNPSSTINIWECAHPIKVSIPAHTHDYYVTHNGIIHNADLLKKDHDKEGIPYTTRLRQYWMSEEGNIHKGVEKFNDSEALAIELAKSLEDPLMPSIDGVRGSIAFIAHKVDRKTGAIVALYWGRNYQNPLHVFKDENFLVITSKGKGKDIEGHCLFWYDYASKTYGEKKYMVGIAQTVGYNTYGYDKGDYEDELPTPPKYVPAEIPLIGAAADEQAKYDLDKWMDDNEELTKINESLSKCTDLETREFLLDEKFNLEASIKRYSEKYPDLA